MLCPKAKVWSISTRSDSVRESVPGLFLKNTVAEQSAVLGAISVQFVDTFWRDAIRTWIRRNPGGRGDEMKKVRLFGGFRAVFIDGFDEDQKGRAHPYSWVWRRAASQRRLRFNRTIIHETTILELDFLGKWWISSLFLRVTAFLEPGCVLGAGNDHKGSIERVLLLAQGI